MVARGKREKKAKKLISPIRRRVSDREIIFSSELQCDLAASLPAGARI
jgi:hypothetical protein